jgi:hypothetical protein
MGVRSSHQWRAGPRGAREGGRQQPRPHLDAPCLGGDAQFGACVRVQPPCRTRRCGSLGHSQHTDGVGGALRAPPTRPLRALTGAALARAPPAPRRRAASWRRSTRATWRASRRCGRRCWRMSGSCTASASRCAGASPQGGAEPLPPSGAAREAAGPAPGRPLTPSAACPRANGVRTRWEGCSLTSAKAPWHHTRSPPACPARTLIRGVANFEHYVSIHTGAGGDPAQASSRGAAASAR